MIRPALVALLLFAPAFAEAAACTIGEAGKMHYTAGVMEFCDGADWKSMKGASAGACTAGDAGKSRYSSSKYQFCDGGNWYDMKGSTVSTCTVGDTGKQRYASSLMQFCDGANWYSMAGGCAVTPGSQTFTSAGSTTFTVPCYNSLTVKVWGGGGGGAGFTSWGAPYMGYAGSASSFNGTVVANGGGTSNDGTPIVASGGTALGGDVNQTGASSSGQTGGAGASGGAGGTGAGNSNGGAGNAPGGGGGGCGDHIDIYATLSNAGGGGGGYAIRTYTSGQLTVASSVTVVVGSGGAGGYCEGDLLTRSGSGALGRIEISWN